MIVRELITKLGFKVDTVALGRYNSKINTAKKQMRDFSNGLQSVASGIRNVGIGLTAFVTLPITALGFAAVKTSADLEKAKIALEVFLGSEERAIAVQKELVNFAKETPFQILGIQETAGQLLAAGVESEKLIETMNALGNAAKGDQAIFQRLVLNFSQVQTQGKLTGRELRDFLVNQVPLVRLLAKELGVSEAAIKDMTSKGEISFKDVERAFFNASKEGGFFFDLMKKQSKTLSGRFSNLQDSMTVFLGELGTAIDEALNLKAVISGLSTKITEWSDKFKALSPVMKKVIVFLGIIIASIGPLLIGIGLVISAVLALAAASLVLDIAMGPLVLIIGAIALAIGIMIGLIVIMIEDFITWKAGGKSAIGLILFLFDKLKAKVKETVGSIKQSFVDMWQSILDSMPPQVQKMFGLLGGEFTAGPGGEPSNKNAGAAKDVFGNALNTVGLGIPGLIEGVSNLFKTDVSVTVPPGTNEQQAEFLQTATEAAVNVAMNKQLNSAVIANPRKEN